MADYLELDQMEGFERFYFAPSGTLGQGRSLFNRSKQLVFEAKLIKFHLFKACDYDFVNHTACRTIHHKVGKVITTSTGFNSMSFVTSSYFKLDGENIWDIFNNNGVTINAEVEGFMKYKYKVFMNGTLIARIELCGSHLYEYEPCYNKLKDIPTNYNARIDMNPDYIYMVFLMMFTISMVERSM